LLILPAYEESSARSSWILAKNRREPIFHAW
jgi:hypothetical protein